MKRNKRFFSSFYFHNQHKQLFCSEPIESFLIYKNFKINLLTGEKISSSLSQFWGILSGLTIDQKYPEPIVIHLMYEFGFDCIERSELVPENKPLAIYIHYLKSELLSIHQVDEQSHLSASALSFSSVDEYESKFEKVYQHLLDGDCYQLNLTMPFYFRLSQKIGPESFLNRLWQRPFKIGAYAHGTYIDVLDKLYLSNSPECLFQISTNKKTKKKEILSMPIKGTAIVTDDSEREAAWSKLVASKKDEAELYMISDLMRNDLTKINLMPAKVLHKKYPLHVPGLVHQFSVIKSEIKNKTSIKDIVKNLFPGGSITGAPKVRAMEVAKELEKYDRGFYCGSTILLHEESITASINIRSLEVDYIEDEVKYGAGGGITLLSEKSEEFDEAIAKMKSFLLLLN